MLRGTKSYSKGYLVCRVVYTEAHTADQGFNPFGLPAGTEFHILTASNWP